MQRSAHSAAPSLPGWTCALLALVLVATPALASAQGTDGERFVMTLDLGVEHSDNPGRFSPRGPDDTVLVPRASFDLDRSGEQWRARGSGFAEYRFSTTGDFEDELRANLALRADRSLRPAGLEWTFQNVASVEPVDLLASDSPENRQQTNVFMTGPNWQLRPGAPTRAVIDARYVNSWAEDNDEFDSDRLQFSTRVLRQIAERREAWLGAELAEVRYRDDIAVIEDYRRYDLLAGLSAGTDLFTLDLSGGYTRIDPTPGARLSEPVARLAMAWEPDRTRRVRLLAFHELTDSVRQLSAGIDRLDLPVATVGRLPVNSQIFELSSVELGWDDRVGRVNWSLTPFVRDYGYPLDPAQDFTELGADARAFWRITPSMTLQAGLGSYRRRFDNVERRDTDLRASLFLVRRFNPRWSGRIGGMRYQRDSNIASADSRENIIAVQVTFHGGR